VSALAVSNLVLWLLVVLLACIVWALVRQIGVLHERIAPVGALMLPQGLKVGEPAPPLEVLDLDGRAQLIGAARRSGRSLLLAFVSPTCPVCKTLLPVLRSARVAERDWLDIILGSDGDVAAHRQFIAAQALQQFSYVNSAVLGMTYQVNRLPYAVLIDEQGTVRARGLINSREHLESLFEAKRRGVASLQEYFESAPGSQAA
jgi:methylamine dehydrogenase accessory protein MauD